MRLLPFIFLSLLLSCCKQDNSGPIIDPGEPDPNYDYGVYDTTKAPLIYPDYVAAPIEKSDNPNTINGVYLGKKLFFDPILSRDSTVSCNSCHQQQFAFAHNSDFFQNQVGNTVVSRNSMPLFNLAWNNIFGWDARKNDLEEKVLNSIENPHGINGDIDLILSRISSHDFYRKDFYQAFGVYQPQRKHIQWAIGQYLRSLISFDSKFDMYLQGRAALSDQELLGFQIFSTEQGDCFHCHSPSSALFQNGQIENNGLDSVSAFNDFEDLGYGGFTLSDFDKGKFKAVSLRNIGYTAPYMHDGRFKTLEEVIAHYNSGGHFSPTVSATMKYVDSGLGLNSEEKAALIAFLQTLNDSSFIQDSNHNISE